MSSTRTETAYPLDVDVLLAICVGSHLHHRAALGWFASEALGAGWVTTPLTESALLRLLLNPKVIGERLTMGDAGAVLAALRARPGWAFLPDDSSLAAPVIATQALVGPTYLVDDPARVVLVPAV